MVNPVDVLIITSADGEDDAVREVDEGACGPWQETPGPEDYGFPVWLRNYRSVSGRTLHVALSRCYRMGMESAGNAAGRLADAYKPQCLAMCGVCAGSPHRTRLGDVIVADRVWNYEEGEQVNAVPGGRPNFRPDTIAYPFRAQWTQAAQQFEVPSNAPWLSMRPRPRDLQGIWLLRELLEQRDPSTTARRPALCADWEDVVRALEDRGLLTIKAGKLRLTKQGREHIQNVLVQHGGQLPEQEAWKVEVGPLGTGSRLVKDVDIWDRLQDQQRQVRGLDMESSVIGLTAHIHGIEMIVVKGVMDYAEAGRSQGFRKFAARAAAEVLLGFLRKHLKPRTAASSGVLTPNTSPPPVGVGNPATLLNAAYEVVPFFDVPRRRELETLKKWCAATEDTSVRLFFGPGGSGKTRLFIEWSKRLLERGWQAGFLREQSGGKPVTGEQLDALVASPVPLFVVVDYAESHPDVQRLLWRVAARGHGAPIRVALLAREVADWWQELRQESDVRMLLDQSEPLRLEPVPLGNALRQEAFWGACRRYADVCKRPMPTLCPDLSDPRFGRMLYLHMAALASVEGLPVSADALLDEILAHEERFWRRSDQEQYTYRLDRAEFAAGARRAVAAIVLLGGMPDREAVEKIVTRCDGPRSKHFSRFLHWLYPNRNAYVAPLEPDLLGEALVANVLSDKATAREYLVSVFEDSDAGAMANGFRVLGRLGVYRLEAKGWIEQVLCRDVRSRAGAAFVAALSLLDQTAQAPLGNVLAQALEREGSLELARSFEKRLPQKSVSLREVSVWVTKRLLQELLQGDNKQETLQERARLLNDLGNRLSDLGRREEALEATREAVEKCRTLAEQRTEAFVSNLATSLNNLGNRLSELGQREEALDVTQEAVEIHRKLAGQRPDAFLSNLAVNLTSLGTCLSNLGRPEEALEATREAAEIRRALAEQWPDVFLPDLALSLNNLGVFLNTLGRPEEALEATREAVEKYRVLASQRPDALLPDLAMSLNNLGHDLLALGRQEDALKAILEATEKYRNLAEQRPDTFSSDLAVSLTNVGAVLGNLGRWDEALEATREGVEVRRVQAEQRPDTFLPDLATSLNNLSILLGNLGRQEEALKAIRGAVEIRRTLANQRPDVFLPDLASSLGNLGNRLSALGRRKESVEATGEAVEICRALAGQRPDTFLHSLAVSLNNLGVLLGDLRRPEQALEAIREAVEIHRKLAGQRPEAFLPDFAGSLDNLGIRLSALGRHEEALVATREAVEKYRALAEKRPDACLPDLAASLNNLGLLLGNLDRREEALEATREALAKYRALAKQRPEAFLPGLAGSLGNLGIGLRALGRHEEALVATREAVEKYRALAGERPDAFLPQLGGSLMNLGMVLDSLGKREESLEASREAVEIRRALAGK